MNDLALYGNSFTVDGERVHPSEVTIDADGNCFVGIDLASKPDVTAYWIIEGNDTYEIPQEIFDRISKSMDEMIMRTICPPTPEPPPVTPGCDCPSYAVLHLPHCNAWMT